ncbi:hypothetical protein OOK60_12925 [Trichothermofontia sichuanensis B231]|uniref:hypothetical protein n=1 Tax=Trichothermofontia sichuanensis TaxID=3045816 RepID=UPI00224583DF|nr:hypothetical protein [Trichothermofontia sichuanensis]UZQ53402.1 hypothetical protein OOK60_12925 [Trichothermofontia sichuanensis B231]
MSNPNENGSRLDRIEALMLELATASIRHDNEFSRLNAVLNQISEQQAANARQIEANTRQIEINTRQQALNQEDIRVLTASIQGLRNLVADYIQARSHS